MNTCLFLLLRGIVKAFVFCFTLRYTSIDVSSSHRPGLQRPPEFVFGSKTEPSTYLKNHIWNHSHFPKVFFFFEYKPTKTPNVMLQYLEETKEEYFKLFSPPLATV